MPPTFGDPRALRALRALERSAGRMGALPLVGLCLDPAGTRRWVDAGRPGPCYRCLAARPELASGCHFVEVGAALRGNDEPPAPAGDATLFG